MDSWSDSGKELAMQAGFYIRAEPAGAGPSQGHSLQGPTCVPGVHGGGGPYPVPQVGPPAYPGKGHN